MHNKYNYNTDQKILELADKKLYIFDMDGTVYLGNRVFEEARQFIKLISTTTKKILFFTNNASKNKDNYREKIIQMGFPSNKIDILTSADVLIEFLKKHRQNKSIYLLGTPLLRNAFENADIHLFESSQDKTLSPDIVVSSFDTTLTYDKLERACTYIRNGAEWLTTHPDINCPVENGGYIPDCGAINALISVSADKPMPRAFGKPYSDVVVMLEEIYDLLRKDMVMFGDRLYTDIALGKNNGMMAVLMLTGEGTFNEAMQLRENEKPDLIFDNFSCIQI